jgi:peptide-methionine (S)-S-oxide reductase
MNKLKIAPFAGLALSLIAVSAQSTPALQTALFAGGCFWTMEHGMEVIPGVTNVVSGYSGGPEQNPTYQQVSSETTGHRETVQVTYDPARISYGQLVQRYFRLTDPTQADGQACDRGPSYRPAIFVTPQQAPIANAAKAQVGALLHRPIATAILPAGRFWPAEAYHQDFARRNVAHYQAYRIGCGRDARLAAVWGPNRG